MAYDEKSGRGCANLILIVSIGIIAAVLAAIFGG